MIGFVPILLILLEPDMGTGIVYAVISLFMIFWGGISLFGLFAVSWSAFWKNRSPACPHLFRNGRIR